MDKIKRWRSEYKNIRHFGSNADIAIGDKQGLTICYSAIGIDYLNAKKYNQALEYFNKSLPMAQEMHSLEDLIEIHENLSLLYAETKDYEKAYENYKL